MVVFNLQMQAHGYQTLSCNQPCVPHLLLHLAALSPWLFEPAWLCGDTLQRR